MDAMNDVLKAALFAAESHRDQRRKGKRAEPYINHCLEVAKLVGEVTADDDIIIAALLHDVVEDCGVLCGLIADSYGIRVATFVAEVTDDKSLPKAERKALQLKHAPMLSLGAKLIKLADQTSNMRSVARDPPVGWDPVRIMEYLQHSVKMASLLNGTDAVLESKLARAQSMVLMALAGK